MNEEMKQDEYEKAKLLLEQIHVGHLPFPVRLRDETIRAVHTLSHSIELESSIVFPQAMRALVQENIRLARRAFELIAEDAFGSQKAAGEVVADITKGRRQYASLDAEQYAALLVRYQLQILFEQYAELHAEEMD